jgi:hypothetical protein
MPCETLTDFKLIDTYRKSFNGDLQMAKSKPAKLAAFDGFKFDDHKGLLLVVGTIANALRDELRKNASSLKATGLCSFTDSVVRVTVKSGKLTHGELEKALALATVKRKCEVVDAEGAADDAEDNDEAEREHDSAPLPPGLAKVSASFHGATKALEAFMAERLPALEWHDSEIKTQQDATRKLAEIKATIVAFNQTIIAARQRAKQLGDELNAEMKDPNSKFDKTAAKALVRAVAVQNAIILDAENRI